MTKIAKENSVPKLTSLNLLIKSSALKVSLTKRGQEKKIIMWQMGSDYISTEGFLFKASERISLTIERVLEMKNLNLFKMFFDIQMVKLSAFEVRDFSRRN